MKLNKDSGLVQIWLKNVRNGNVKREQVPRLSNLREVVWALLDEDEKQSDDVIIEATTKV